MTIWGLQHFCDRQSGSSTSGVKFLLLPNWITKDPPCVCCGFWCWLVLGCGKVNDKTGDWFNNLARAWLIVEFGIGYWFWYSFVVLDVDTGHWSKHLASTWLIRVIENYIWYWYGSEVWNERVLELVLGTGSRFLADDWPVGVWGSCEWYDWPAKLYSLHHFYLPLRYNVTAPPFSELPVHAPLPFVGDLNSSECPLEVNLYGPVEKSSLVSKKYLEFAEVLK